MVFIKSGYYLFVASIILNGLGINAQTCEQSPNTCINAKCVSREECAAFGDKFTWSDEKCPGEKCGCCEQIQVEECQASTCPNGKCISREECAALGDKFTWFDEKCPGEKCGCCEQIQVDECQSSDACTNGKCISREECADLGDKFTWFDEKCPGEKCGCCEQKSCLKFDPTCTRLKGKCFTSGESCPTGYVPHYNLCGTNEKCFCCVPSCFNDDKCLTLPKGKCVANEKECPSGMTFTQAMCKKDGVDGECGCCHSTCLTIDTDCVKKGGKCVESKEKCPAEKNLVFIPTLCKTDPTGESNCGCCAPGCRLQDPVCRKKGGKCVSKVEECPIAKGYTFDETICKTDIATGETKCGCCVPPPPCKAQDDLCIKRGGKCVSTFDECPTAKGYIFDATLCRTDAATGETKCGCCIAPPPCKTQDQICKKKGGKCVSEVEECPTAKGYIFDATLCRTDAATGETKCGCCVPPPPPCKTQDPICGEKGGKCVNNIQECAAGSTFIETLCRADTATGEVKCGCCVPPPPPCLTSDPSCKEKGGLCTTNKFKCINSGRIFDDSYCRTSVTGTSCGCCYKQISNECKQQTVCEAKKGKCVSKISTANLCPTDTHFADPELCGSNTCTCCIPKA